MKIQTDAIAAKFYGIGLGPGDPGLVTLKALSCLQLVDRIFSVASRQSERSVSADIIKALPDISASLCELEFVMSRNREERLKRIDDHASIIAEFLDKGESCAFVTIGDPMTYSTCSYLLRALLDIRPGLPVEIIPGVNSWSALAAKTCTPLVEDKQILRIVPSYDESDKPDFPPNSSTILLKTYKSRNKLLEQVPGESTVIYGANLGLENEVTASGRDEIEKLPQAYLSMLAVKYEKEKQF